MNDLKTFPFQFSFGLQNRINLITRFGRWRIMQSAGVEVRPEVD